MRDSLTRPDGAKIVYEHIDFRVPYHRDTSPRVPIVLHHGMGRGMDWFWEWLPILGESRREIYRFDCRACGESTAPEDGWDATDIIADARAIIAKTGAESVDFVGFDSGGLVGLALAGKEQNLFRSLTLVNTPFTFNKAILETYRLGYETEGAAIRALGVRAYFDASSHIRLTNLARTDPAMVEWQTAAQTKVPPGPAGDQIDQFHAMETEDLAASLDIPTLIIVGDRSPLCVLEDQIRVYRRMRRAGIAVVPRMAGGVNLQAARDCARLTCAFIADLNLELDQTRSG